jgi:Domain of unknown function (DUF4258)
VNVKNEPVTDFIITLHAAFEMQRRGVTSEMVNSVLAKPEIGSAHRSNRFTVENCEGPARKSLLGTVFVEVDRVPAEIVTVYRTSKIEEYWNEDES